MSATLFDLGMRLRAAHEQRPVARTHHSLALPPHGALAVVTAREDGVLTVSASDGEREASHSGEDALEALDEFAVSVDGVHRTLVVADHGTLRDLLSLALRSPERPCAPVIAWWDQRADHPGSGAVHMCIAAARARFALGTSPEAERDLGTWLRWFDIDDAGPAALLRLARATTTGPALPGLLDCAGADSRSWDAFAKRLRKGQDWRRPDSRTDAALGLATRSDAAELFDSLLLGDPLAAVAASFAGSVVCGTVTSATKGCFTVRADRPVSRLRPGARVAGWEGEPHDVQDSEARLRDGEIEAAVMGTDAALDIAVRDAVFRPSPLSVGDRVSLRARPVDPFQQQRARRNLSQRYRTAGNWLAGRGTPTPRRGNVPLDVVLAAADEA